MNSTKILIASAALLVMAGCATQPAVPIAPIPTPEPAIKADAVIAQDFVNIMVQIDELSPWSSVLNFGLDEDTVFDTSPTAIKAKHNFANALRAAAVKSGYSVKTVEDEQSENFVSFTITEFEDPAIGGSYTYDLSVGDIDFRRVYKPLDGYRVEPIKPMLIRGTDVTNLESDDALFANQPTRSAGVSITKTEDTSSLSPDSNTFDSPVAQNERAMTESDDSIDTLASGDVSDDSSMDQLLVDEINELVVADNALERSSELLITKPGDVVEPIGTTDSEGFEKVRKINIAVSGTSNYESLLADKQNVVEEILIFGDDSYVLGARNKKILGDMMTNFDPDTDVVSVVGCSTGVTKIENGNAALAIGRANRVKEALLYSGVPHDKIYDEGCWSPTPNSTPFPNRGVVITVKRNVDNG